MPKHSVTSSHDPRLAADELVNPTAHFLDEWIDSHVVGPIVVPVGADPAAALAQRCARDAAKRGIDVEAIEGEVGDLKDYIAEVLVEEHPQLDRSGTPLVSKR